MPWMGPSHENDPSRPSPTPAAATPAAEPGRPAVPAGGLTTIGKSVQIKGEVAGSEDLHVDGKIDGTIRADGRTVTIGQHGEVLATVQAKFVVVHGRVRGDVVAEEKAEITATGDMQGNVRAPRIVLADGARFKGTIDMDAKPAAAPQPRPAAPPPRPAGAPPASSTNPQAPPKAVTNP